MLLFRFLSGPCDSIEGAEAFAMLKAVELAIVRCWMNVIFVGDSLNVINSFKGDIDAVSWDAIMYIDAAKLLLPKLHCAHFNWIPRSFNEVAHHVCQWDFNVSHCTNSMNGY